jgi:hypothetical protein
MRKVSLTTAQLPGDVPGQVRFLEKAVRSIATASQENDVIDLAAAYTIVGAFTATRTLNVGTATLADLIAVFCTLITDLQAGGANRTV